MKQLLLTTLLALVLFPSINFSQRLESVLVNAAETPTTDANGVLLTWTLGELMVEYYDNGPVLDQGYLQCRNLLTATHEPGGAGDLAWNLSIWPNPAGAQRLNVQSTAHLEITLFDSLGRALKRARCSNETIRMDLSPWPSGSYWLHAMDKDGHSRVYQIQKL